MDDVLAFRTGMAEEGYEFTPKHAARTLEYIEKFRAQIQKQARKDPAEIEKLSNLDLKQKQSLMRQLAETGYEVSIRELDELIGLVLHVYDQEKM